jgi:hypothetical protein
MGNDGNQNSELLILGSEMCSLKSTAGSTMLQEEPSGVHLPAVVGNLSFPTTSRPALGPNQHPVQKYQGLCPGVTWPGREVAHSLPSSAEVKNEWSYTSTSYIRLHGVVRYSFTLHCPYEPRYCKRTGFEVPLHTPY